MATVKDLLNEVWALFRQDGITDVLEIIENVGAVLAADLAIPEGFRLSKSSNNDVPQEQIMRLIKQARDMLGGNGAELFDRYVLFRFASMFPGGRYPTPRHIIATMLRVAQVTPENSLADFACGSGGFLVHRSGQTSASIKPSVGVEISFEWAKLAFANIHLHAISGSRIISANILRVCGPSGELRHQEFDRIVMNPPFGEIWEETLVRDALGISNVSRSQVVLSLLALQKLTSGGQTAILLDSGPLSVNGAGERKLRQELTERYQLKALISLPKDALQPFSPLQTYILLAQNTVPMETSQTWFLRVERDGYPTGRGRDLTELPNELASDLPFIEALLDPRSRSSSQDIMFGESGRLLFQIFEVGGQRLLGLAIVPTKLTILDVEAFPDSDQMPSFLLIEVRDQNNAAHYVRLSYPASSQPIQLVQNDEVIKLRKLSGNKIFRSKVTEQAVVISADNRLVGVRVPQKQLIGVQDLRPERYVIYQEQEHPTRHPAEIVVDIRNDQRQLARYVESILGRLEMRPIASENLPPPLPGYSIIPFGKLSDEQSLIWNWIEQQFDMNEHARIPRLFTVSALKEAHPSLSEKAINSALSIFERMGVIVSVTISSSNTDEVGTYFRRITERDLASKKVVDQ